MRWTKSRLRKITSSLLITTIIIMTDISGATITTTITIIDDKSACDRSNRTLWGPVFLHSCPTLFLPSLLLCCAVEMPVGAVEHGVRRRRPLGPSREGRPVAVNAARLKLALSKFFRIHRLEFEIGFFGDHDDLRERLARPENVGASLGRRLENAEEHHRPPVSDQGWDRDRHGVAGVSVET